MNVLLLGSEEAWPGASCTLIWGGLDLQVRPGDPPPGPGGPDDSMKRAWTSSSSVCFFVAVKLTNVQFSVCVCGAGGSIGGTCSCLFITHDSSWGGLEPLE